MSINKSLRHLRTYESIAPEADDKNKAAAFVASITPDLLYVVDTDSSSRDPFEVKYIFGVDQEAFEGMQLEVLVSITCEIEGNGDAPTHDDPGAGPTFNREYDFAINRVTMDDDTVLDAVALTEVPNIEAVRQLVDHQLRADIDWEKYEQIAWDNR